MTKGLEKYRLASAKLVGDTKTYNELKKGIGYFDLSLWNEQKIDQQMFIDFSCRKKNLVEGEYTCKVCGCNKVYIQSIQTRSADEASDVYALCSNASVCKNRPWKVG